MIYSKQMNMYVVQWIFFFLDLQCTDIQQVTDIQITVHLRSEKREEGFLKRQEMSSRNNFNSHINLLSV